MIRINKVAGPASSNDAKSSATVRAERDRVFAEGRNALDTIDEFLRGSGTIDAASDERLWTLYHKLIDEDLLTDEDRELVNQVRSLMAPEQAGVSHKVTKRKK